MEMAGGNWGKVLKVNLSDGSSEEIEIEESLYHDFLGGSGLAAKLFFDNKGWEVDPLSPENPFMIMLGPLSGLVLPGVSRLSICARSPLTKIWGESCMGGHFAPQLKGTGYDGIIVTGASENPVYLMVTEEGAEIRDASHLWGKDTYETEDMLKKEAGSKLAQVICIGPAGENLVKYACVMNDKGSTSGRGGMGAVMGSKKLKAVVALGKLKPPVADEEGLKQIRKRLNEAIKYSLVAESLRSFGSNVHMTYGMAIGDVPVKNWREAMWDDGPEKLGGTAVAKTILQKNRSCYGCSVGCKRITRVESGPFAASLGPGPEYEAAVSLGTLQRMSNLEANNKANELCDRYGMDVISTGSTIAYATEAYESGILTDNETGGIRLGWNQPETLIDLIKKIAFREGVGDILAEGTRAISERYGGKEFAIHVKGLECPMHDPRALWGMALTYATSIRGACHCSDTNLYADMGLLDHKDLGLKRSWPFKTEGKAIQTIAGQTKCVLANSALICEFMLASICGGMQEMVDMLNPVTGFDYTIEELTKVGERIWYIKRALGNLCGATREDDRVPRRILEPHIEGDTSNLTTILYPMNMTMGPTGRLLAKIGSEKLMNNVRKVENKFLFPNLYKVMKTTGKLFGLSGNKKRKVPFDEMIEEYYRLRDIDDKGRPSRERLESLGLGDVADTLFSGPLA